MGRRTILLLMTTIYKLQTDRVLIVGVPQCVLEYERSFSLRDLWARVSSTQAYNMHAHTLVLIYITAACTPYALLQYVCLMVRAGRIMFFTIV